MMMRGDQARHPVLRRDYRPPAWLVEQVELVFRLDPDQTRVSARLAVRRNPKAADQKAPLVLDGVGLDTHRVAINGQVVPRRGYNLTGESMVIGGVPEAAEIETEVSIAPVRNTALEGLYASGSALLTQCEAEGFRKITWFPDRPDVMARFRVRLEADRDRYPVLLSNGNCVDAGTLDEDRHYTVWDDPFPKPSYLFALVAGRLASVSDEFVTASGRRVALYIHSEAENLGRLEHAMDSLKRSMAWDEERFGLEYDLDVYHIVATHDFNMGAMENKSLNIFNARYVLADRDTATDADYQAVEAVIAHEYFHNWTGNRVTCQDWFQLTLKEGLTVFRDQEFTADHHSPAVKRIHDVANLMARQFPEDAGPMAHSIRPERYVEINNFYTATVYEKGAEVVRMYQTLLGRDGFRRGMDLYFQRHDGQAVTCDDFLAAMADANGRDLRQFERWYRQVGTPVLEARGQFDEDTGEYSLTFRQRLPDHADNRELGPLLIPVEIGFLDSANRTLPVTLAGEREPGPHSRLLLVTEQTQTFRFRNLPADALPSLLRNFSSPVRLEFEYSRRDLARLAGHDADPVNRWQAMRRLAEGLVTEALAEGRLCDPALLVSAWRAVLEDEKIDPALAAELLTLPGESELAQAFDPVDVEGIHGQRKALRAHLAGELGTLLVAVYERAAAVGRREPGADGAGARRLANLVLSIMAADPASLAADLANQRYRSADNMTDRLAAMTVLVHHELPGAAEVLADFESCFADDPLVMDKWFTVQATRPSENTVERVEALLEHPAFSLKNPNKVRSLLGAFGHANPNAFHRADAAGYRLLGRLVRELDRLNPQVAARLVTAFNRWRAYDDKRAAVMQDELAAVRDLKGLSPDVGEIVGAALRKRH